jgi:hypothetical protein
MYLLFIAQDILILMQARSITRAIGRGWALKIETFWALKWQRAKHVLFWPKKVEIFRAHPFHRGPSDRFACIKIIKSKRYIKKTGTLVILCP